MKKVSSAGKGVSDSPTHTPVVGSRTKKHTKLHNNNIFTEDLAQTLTGSVFVASVSVSPYEPCLVDSVAHGLLSLNPLASAILPPSLRVPLDLPSVWPVLCHHCPSMSYRL